MTKSEIINDAIAKLKEKYRIKPEISNKTSKKHYKEASEFMLEEERIQGNLDYKNSYVERNSGK